MGLEGGTTALSLVPGVKMAAAALPGIIAMMSRQSDAVIDLARGSLRYQGGSIGIKPMAERIDKRILGERRVNRMFDEMAANNRRVAPERRMAVRNEAAEQAKICYKGSCDRIRRTPEGEEYWQKMMDTRKEVSEDDFLDNVNVSEMLDDGESWSEFKTNAAQEGEPLRFYKSDGDIYHTQHAGFEMIFDNPASVADELPMGKVTR